MPSMYTIYFWSAAVGGGLLALRAFVARPRTLHWRDVGRLAERAGAWDPAHGTTPWGWARHQLRAMASAYIGQYGPDLDSLELEMDPTGPSESGDIDPIAVLDALATSDRVCRELRATLGESVRERDARVWLEFEMEQSSGNASPAVTVAEIYGVTPANVRKIVQRVRGRVDIPTRSDLLNR